MPKDQEPAVTRRRSRRQEAAVGDQPAVPEAAAPEVQPLSNIAVSEASSPPIQRQRRNTRGATVAPVSDATPSVAAAVPSKPSRAIRANAATSQANEGAATTNMDTLPPTETSGTPVSENGDSPSVSSMRSRRPTGSSASNRRKKSTTVLPIIDAPDSSLQTSMASGEVEAMSFAHASTEPSAADRKHVRRESHRSESVETPEISPIMGETRENIGEAASGAAKKSARPARARSKSTSATTSNRSGLTETAGDPHRSIARPDGSAIAPESTEESSAMSPAVPSFGFPYEPAARPSYRFARPRQETNASAAGSPTEGIETPSQRKEQGSPVAEHRDRPLRRTPWVLQNGQEAEASSRDARPASRERVQPHVPGGTDAYRSRQSGPRTGGAGPTRISDGTSGHTTGQHGPHAAPTAPQSGRGASPYSPGGRGGHTPTQQPPATPHDMPYVPANNQGAGPTGGYDSYDPYAFDPRESRPVHDRPAQSGRSVRGRTYTNQPGGYEQREQRTPRQPVRPPSPADYYRREQGLSSQRDARGQTSGRGAAGSHGIHDRRNGGSASRGPVSTGGRAPRETGYSSSLYTPVAPTLAQTPREHGDRSDRSMSIASHLGDAVPGTRSSGPTVVSHTLEVGGILWQTGGSFGSAELLDGRTLQPVARVSAEDIRRMGLRQGDLVTARAEERGGRRVVVAVDTVNEMRPEEAFERPMFDKLTASFPDRRIRLEHGPQPTSVRIIDLFAPLGFGSRALVVAPPKTGKTTLMREAAEAVLASYPSAVVMAVLVGERPEEVTDLRARLEPRGGLVYAASFDEDTARHAWLVQVAVERAKRLAESGRDAFMVLDSLTRLARAENLSSRGQGRTLSGGIDAQALDTGRRAFGAARNLDEGGSLTILATCLVDTGSRQDDVVYEEFKGTGNMELHLSRELAQRRLFPAVDAVKSSTRREEMLLTPEELRASTALRRRLADLPPAQATQQLLSVMERTSSNAALLQAIEQSGWTSSTR